MIKAVLPQMRKQQSGLIINITSIAGYMGLPYRGVYSASKGALELITEAFRMELKGFNINIVITSYSIHYTKLYDRYSENSKLYKCLFYHGYMCGYYYDAFTFASRTCNNFHKGK